MMISNDPNKNWVNGTLGIISHISDGTIKVHIDGFDYEVYRETFESREAVFDGENINYEVTLSISQYPLILAYAITIHKSQGKTYQKIACDIKDCFAPGQAYVALSRCSSLNGLTLFNKITKDEVRVDSDVKDFYILNQNSNSSTIIQ